MHMCHVKIRKNKGRFSPKMLQYNYLSMDWPELPKKQLGTYFIFLNINRIY